MLTSLLDIIFPPLCHSCRAHIPHAQELHLCGRCREEMPLVAEPACLVCGVPFRTEEGIPHACGECSVRPPRFVSARAAGVYDGRLRDLIHRFKYDRKTHLRRPLALLTAERLSPFVAETGAHLIVPVPLHVKRLRERGFNQAVLIGRILSRRWRVPISVDNLRRVRWTEPQIALSAVERIANVSGAFDLRDPALVKGKTILLLDDVFTTGSTARECAKVLQRGGADKVFVATVARAVPL